MRTPELTAALAEIDVVFNGEASRAEFGCARYCCTAEDAAYLRSPHTRVPAALLNRFLYKSPQHFADHAAAMRRLLPQGAHAMADGTLEDTGWGPLGLSRVDWRSWPGAQARAVEVFFGAWWREALGAAEPPYPVRDMFEVCCSVLGEAAPLLAVWEAGPEADAHLADCVEWWSHDLLADRWPFTWWRPDDEPHTREELQTWLGRHAPARLRSLGLTDLADRTALLALPYDTRWNDPYWSR
ncbi:hypothetical protein [Streptomyces seoulensis]|uniref:hypothetical protein n=1 Tax=Streptomyces seoulensis TaxID=73044 RepID=UPI001FCBBD0F|nr:hypothetical protein [Streptomyces seoulensis]BDH04605.1 hypothetical protein HEK131_18320 [Streptomyces seoulensis]